MNYYQELKKYLNNNLFTSYSLEIDFPKIYNFNANQKAFRDILTKITKIYDKNKFIKQNEHQFEDEFISKVLEILGWCFVRQDEKSYKENWKNLIFYFLAMTN